MYGIMVYTFNDVRDLHTLLHRIYMYNIPRCYRGIVSLHHLYTECLYTPQ